MQKASKTELNASNLPRVSIVAHVASVKVDGRPYAVVGLAMGSASGGPELDGVLLHWACVSGQGQDWQQPPAGWHTDPDYSQGAGTILFRDPFPASSVACMLVQLYNTTGTSFLSPAWLVDKR